MKTTIANPVNTTNAMGKKRKRPKNMHKSKKDEENILSKDIEDDNIRYMMDTKKNLKPREDLKSTFTLKTLRFKPQKYKGSFLPYHLRWIFNNNVKSNEIVLLNEIEGLENEINRLKALKLLNRECRKLAGLPFGITTNFCQCCHLLEKKKHDCSHKYCNDNCPRKKQDELVNNLLKNKLKEVKENISKENSVKNLFPDTIKKKEENININNFETLNIKDSQNNNINNDPCKLNKITIDKNMNDNNHLNELININESKKENLNSAKKRLIFGTIERNNKERRNIFLVKSDLNIAENNNINEIVKYDSSNNIIKLNEVKRNIIEKQKNDMNNEYCDSNNYNANIESESEGEIEKNININSEKEKNESISDEKNIDKENEEDDVIIINQTSPQNSDNEK